MLSARIAADGGLRERLARVRAEVQAAEVGLPEWQPPTSLGGARSWAPWGAAVLALAAVALAFVLARAPGPGSPYRYRGPLDVEVEVVRDGRAVPQAGIVEAGAGDRVQYVLTAGRDGYLGVFDLQDDGELFVWTPPRPGGAHRPVQGAALLDDYAGAERIYFVFAPQPFTTEQVAAAADRAWRTPVADLDALPLPDEIHQRSLLLVRP